MDNIYVQLLKRARELIKNKRCDFVCLAIKDAAGYYGDTSYGDVQHALRIVRWIEASISPFFVLDDWLCDHGAKGVSNKAAMRRHRLAWIDRMIEEWKDVED